MSNASLRAPEPIAESTEFSDHPHPLEKVFLSDSYSIEQPFLQITQEGYKISNSDSTEVYNAVRHRQWLKQYFSRFLGMIALLVTLFGGIFVASATLGKENASLIPFATLFFFGLSIVVYLGISKFIAPKRVTTLYKGSETTEKIFEIMPTSGLFIFNKEFHLKDNSGEVIITYKRKFIDSLLRKKWHAYGKQNEYLFTAEEDNIFMAILRRYLNLGRLIPLHFNLNKGGGKNFGSFKRRLSLKDKYKLESNSKAVPSWIIVATAILLDTGEER